MKTVKEDIKHIILNTAYFWTAKASSEFKIGFMFPLKAFVLFATALSVTSCGGSPEYSSTRLNRLVVMGLVANPTALQSPVGGIHYISVDPFISDVNGTGTVSLSIQSCVDRGFENGIQLDCTNAANASPIQNKTIQAPTGAPAGIFGTPERTGKNATGPIAVPLQIPAGFLSSYSNVQQFNGVPYLIVVTATTSKETVRSFRKILITTQVPNQNPMINNVLADGQPLSELPKEEVKVSLEPTSGPETYQVMNADGTIRPQIESMQSVWFTSDGNLPTGITEYSEATSWTPPKTKPAGRAPVLVGVLRDERGGMSVIVKKF